MGVMPVRPLLLTMSWPMMLSMLVQALYNMVDSMFVAQLNSDAFVALSLVFPVQSLITAIQAGTGVGVNTMLSRRLGQKRPEEASAVACHGYFLYFLCWVVFLTLGMLFARPFMELYSDVPRVIEYGVTYLRIVVLFSLGSCMQFAAERVLQASGNSIGPMVIQGVGAIVNLILDPILIFGLLGFPRLEVAGAAIATGLGQVVGMVIGLVMVARSPIVHVSFRGFRPQGAIVADIYRIGLPAIVMQSLFTIMTLGTNKILALFSDTGVFIMGAYFKVQSFVFMPVFGLNNGIMPIMGYNFGAKNRKRLLDATKIGLVIAVAIMAVGTLVFMLIPQVLLMFFNATPQMLEIGVPALRIISICFVFAALGIVFSTFFQAIGNGFVSLLISLLRQLIVILPVAYFLSHWLNSAVGVWWAFPIAELISFLASLGMFAYIYGKRIKQLPRGAD